MDKPDELDLLFPKLYDNTVRCDDCGITCSGLAPYKEHRKSQKHKKCVARKQLEEIINSKLDSEPKIDQSGDIDKIPMRKPFAVCSTCDKEFSGAENYAQHMKCKAHLNKVSTAALMSKVNGKDKVEGNKESATQDDPEQELLHVDKVKDRAELECKDCEKVFSGIIPYRIHMKSKVHSRKLDQIKISEELKDANLEFETDENDDFVCRTCCVTFSSGESAELHTKTKKHLLKVELKKFKKEKEEAESNKQKLKASLLKNHKSEFSEIELEELRKVICGGD